LEVLVASVLMGMLVTILTMIFNQSAIAWRTGKAGVADMSETERKLSRIHAYADSVLPYTGGSANYCIVSPWDDAATDDSTTFNKRGVRKASDLRKKFQDIGGAFYNDVADYSRWQQGNLGDPDVDRESAFVVGVRSAGPDRQMETDDDISTWPEEVE
jgi:hypothetical protein